MTILEDKKAALKKKRELEDTHLERDAELAVSRARFTARTKGELARLFALWNIADSYLANCEKAGTDVDNAAYSTTLTLRDTLVERANELYAQREDSGS